MAMVDSIKRWLRSWSLQLVLFIYVAGLSMQFPVSQNLILKRLCQERYDSDICDNLSKHPEAESKVQVASSKLLSLQTVFSDVPGAVAALVLGALSDKIGRKRVMMFPCVGAALVGANMIVQSMIPVISLPLVIINSLTFGLTGGIQTTIATAINVITDTTPEEKRAVRISHTMPFIGLGMIVGMLSSGILPAFFSVTSIYVLFTLCQSLVIIFVVFFVDESLPSSKAKTALSSGSENAAANGGVSDDQSNEGVDIWSGGLKGMLGLVWNSFISGVQVLTSPKMSSWRLHLLVLLGTGMIGNATVMVELNLTLLYTKRAPFEWSQQMFGIYLASKNLMAIFGQALGTAIVLRMLGEKSLRNDFQLLQMGSGFAIVICLFTAYATSTRMMYLAAFFVILSAPGRSAFGSIVSRLVDSRQKGAFMAMSSFLNTLTTPILGLLYNTIYASTVETNPGCVFVCMAAVYTVVFGAIRYVIWKTPPSAGKMEKD